MRNLYIAGLAGVAAAALTAAPAFAQNMTDDAPFTGAYIGGSVGYDIQPNDVGSRINFDRNLDGRFGDSVNTAAGANAFGPGFCNGAAVANNPNGRGCRNDKDGLAYYARVGADQQYGNIVVGVVGEFGKSKIRDYVSAFSTTPASYTMSREINWEGSVRGRIGYAANKTLFYGTFGGGYADIDHDFATTNATNAFTGRGKDRTFGILGGGGIEQKVGKNFSVGMEYMFHKYQDNKYTVRATAGTSPVTNPFILAPNTVGTDFRRSDDQFRWHSLRAVAAFRF